MGFPLLGKSHLHIETAPGFQYQNVLQVSSEDKIRLTSLSFHVNWQSYSSDTAFWNLTLKIQGQGHNSRSPSGFNILSTDIPLVPCELTLPFLGHDFFQSPTLKIQGQSSRSHSGSSMMATSYRPTSPLFHVNPPSHSRNTAFSKFYLENSTIEVWEWISSFISSKQG